MSPLLVETVVDDFMDAHLNLSDVATKYHPQTICSMRNLQNSNKLILDTVLKKSDWAQLILLTALLDDQRRSLLSQLVPRQFFLTKLFYSNTNTRLLEELQIRCLHLHFLMHKNKMAVLTGKYDKDESLPIKRLFSENRHVGLFKTIFYCAGMSMSKDEGLSCVTK